MRWHTILFDVDGTLTDPKVGITTAASLALAHFGIQADPDSLTWMIGPPLHTTLQEGFGLTPEQALEGVRVFREYYNRRGWAENVPYPGIVETLRDLKAAGARLITATTKPEPSATRILEHFGLARHLDLICGAPPSPPEASEKVCVIRNALARAGVKNLSGAVMVGDRLHDVEGAHAAGIQAVGVLYGYGSRRELEDCRADYLAQSVEALRALLLL